MKFSLLPFSQSQVLESKHSETHELSLLSITQATKSHLNIENIRCRTSKTEKRKVLGLRGKEENFFSHYDIFCQMAAT